MAEQENTYDNSDPLSLEAIKKAMNLPSDTRSSVESNQSSSEYDDTDYERLFKEASEEKEGEESSNDREEKKEKKRRRYTQTEREIVSKERQERERLLGEMQHLYANMESIQSQLAQERAARLDAEEERLKILEDQYKELRISAEEEGQHRLKYKVQDELDAVYSQKDRIARERDLMLNQMSAQSHQQQYNQTHQNNTYQNTQQSEYIPPQNPSEVIEHEENFKDWLSDKPFLHRGNPNYSPTLEAISSQLSSQLAIQYKLNGRGNQVYSQDYYDDLTGLLQQNIENMGVNQQQRQRHPEYMTNNHPATPSRYVSPVSSSMNTFSGGNDSYRKEKISADEADMINRFGRVFGNKEEFAKSYVKSKLRR